MTSTSSRSGSALIIVLGFLSFMVVSAVAFAVYMRSERVASSGYHRTMAVRQLVKAGVANAVAQIDAAIGNTPYPGLNVNGGSGNLGPNYWNNCVFTPSNTVPTKDTVPVIPLEGLAYLPPAIINEVRTGARSTHSAKWQNLDYDIGRFAYVAVNVSDFFDVNKVHCGPRYGGANGRISLVHLFQNNEGREFADDVKGDLGKLGKLDDFLGRSDMAEKDLPDVPFVSLADFNVAMFKRASDDGRSLGIYSPFYNYLNEGDWRAIFSIGGGETIGERNVSNADRAGRMLFVTDSYPPTNKHDVIDLAYEQPFAVSDLRKAKKNIILLSAKHKEDARKRLEKDLSLTSLACLVDYLDNDSEPISLAIPGVERVPMVAVVNGKQFADELSFSLKKVKSEPMEISLGEQAVLKETTTYSLELTGAGDQIPFSCVYPFKGVWESGQYSVQVMAKVFFTKPGQKPGTKWGGRCLPNMGLNPSKRDNWKSGTAQLEAEGDKGVFCVTFVSKLKSISVPERVPENCNLDDDTCQSRTVINGMVDMPKNFDQVNQLLREKFFVLQEEHVYKKTDMGGKGEELTRNDTTPKYPNVSSLPFSLYTAEDAGNGVQYVGSIAKGPLDEHEPFDAAKCWKNENAALTSHVAFWVRVVNSSGNTVDLAPATFYDDQLLSEGNSDVVDIADDLTDKAGDGSKFAAMLSAAGKQMAFTKDGESHVLFGNSPASEAGVSVKPFVEVDDARTVFVAIDPRFNHSPEDFLATSENVSWYSIFESFRDKVRDPPDGISPRACDPDVFMFASDQEYLQSVGELAFLPDLGDVGACKANEDPKGVYRKCVMPCVFAGSVDEMIKSHAENSHELSFWRTYPLYKQEHDECAPGDYLFKYFATKYDNGKASNNDPDRPLFSDVNGFKVSPYSEIERIRLAVTANTPMNYWASSTNKVNGYLSPCAETKPDLDECLYYCFNEIKGSDSKTAKDPSYLEWEDVREVTDALFEEFRSKANQDWEDVMSGHAWDYSASGDPKTMLGRTLKTKLHSVDRKMLYSFWHDSMANQQQLFLVFVRVEPIPMGASDSGTADTLPSPQGGRAVALVWRDPAPPGTGLEVNWYNQKGESELFGWNIGSYAPHRTRLLFYHQFD